MKKIQYLLLYSGIICVAFIISYRYFQLMMILGDSMSPTLNNMQIVLLDKTKLVYQENDIIASKCAELDSVIVKRVVACPGDVIVIKNGRLLVNNSESNFYNHTFFEYAGILNDEIVLGEYEYFVIGDNAAQSIDSRYETVGIIKYDDILGKVVIHEK